MLLTHICTLIQIKVQDQIVKKNIFHTSLQVLARVTITSTVGIKNCNKWYVSIKRYQSLPVTVYSLKRLEHILLIIYLRNATLHCTFSFFYSSMHKIFSSLIFHLICSVYVTSRARLIRRIQAQSLQKGT